MASLAPTPKPHDVFSNPSTWQALLRNIKSVNPEKRQHHMQLPLMETTWLMRSFLPQAQTRGRTAVLPTKQPMMEKAVCRKRDYDENIYINTITGSVKKMPRERREAKKLTFGSFPFRININSTVFPTSTSKNIRGSFPDSTRNICYGTTTIFLASDHHKFTEYSGGDEACPGSEQIETRTTQRHLGVSVQIIKRERNAELENWCKIALLESNDAWCSRRAIRHDKLFTLHKTPLINSTQEWLTECAYRVCSRAGMMVIANTKS